MHPITTTMLVIGAFTGALSSSAATGSDKWVDIDDPAEIRELITGRGLDGKYWKYYFRADGIMAYSRNDFPSVREWSITDDGRLCYAVYSLPDRIISCDRIQRSRQLPTEYRFTTETGDFPIEFSDPAQDLIDAVTERAGPE